MKRLLTIAAAAIFAAGVASAATLSANQGLRADGVTAVDASRSILGEAGDGDLNTFFSLGIGGDISIDVSPEILTGGTAVEITFNGASSAFKESAKVFLDGTELGEIYNNQAASALGFAFTNAAGLIQQVAGPNGTSLFFINPNGVVGSVLTLVDTTFDNFAADALAVNSDGFDVAELQAVSTPVIPLPAAGWMLIAGIGGLAAMKRRKKS